MRSVYTPHAPSYATDVHRAPCRAAIAREAHAAAVVFVRPQHSLRSLTRPPPFPSRIPYAGLVDAADILLAEKNRLDRIIAALLVCDASLWLCSLPGTGVLPLATPPADRVATAQTLVPCRAVQSLDLKQDRTKNIYLGRQVLITVTGEQ